MTPENRDNHVECPDSRLRVKYSTTTVGTTCSIPHEMKGRTFLFACWHTTEDMYTVTPSTFSTFALANASIIIRSTVAFEVARVARVRCLCKV